MSPEDADLRRQPDSQALGNAADLAREKVASYRKLLAKLEWAVAEMQALAARHSEEERRALLDSDIEPTQQLMADAERRIAFWEQQLADRERRGI